MMRRVIKWQTKAAKTVAETVTEFRHSILGTNPKPQEHVLALIELYQACKETKKGKKLHASTGLARATRLQESIKIIEPDVSILLPKLSYFITHGEVLGHNDEYSSGLGVKSLRRILISHFIDPTKQAIVIDYLAEENPDIRMVSKRIAEYADVWSKDDGLLLLTTKTFLIKLITDYIKLQNQLRPGNTFGVGRAMDLANVIGSSSSATNLTAKLFEFIKEGKTASDYGFLNLFGWCNGASGADENSLRGIMIKGLIKNKEKRDNFIKTLPGKTDLEIASAIEVNKEFWTLPPQRNKALKL